MVICVLVGAAALFMREKSASRPRDRRRDYEVIEPIPTNPPRAQKQVFQTKNVMGRAYVVDGDTITVQGLSIRLAGIDAPEMDHPYGKNAKWYLVNLTKGQEITAEFHGEQTHAREVATCYLPDGRDLSAEMVKAGLAIDWPKFSGGKYRHLEPPDARKRMWRADARQKGKWPPSA